jgi:hypothetical protein
MEGTGEHHLFLKYFIHLFTCVYITWTISSPCPLPPTPSLSPPPLPLPSRICSALVSNFVEEKTLSIRKTKLFY